MDIIVDDSHVIPDYIKNMSREDLKKSLAEELEKERKKKLLRQKTNPVSA
jgi:hypothetical protein